jgi:hypothetical protein
MSVAGRSAAAETANPTPGRPVEQRSGRGCVDRSTRRVMRRPGDAYRRPPASLQSPQEPRLTRSHRPDIRFSPPGLDAQAHQGQRVLASGHGRGAEPPGGGGQGSRSTASRTARGVVTTEHIELNAPRYSCPPHAAPPRPRQPRPGGPRRAGRGESASRFRPLSRTSGRGAPAPPPPSPRSSPARGPSSFAGSVVAAAERVRSAGFALERAPQRVTSLRHGVATGKVRIRGAICERASISRPPPTTCTRREIAKCGFCGAQRRGVGGGAWAATPHPRRTARPAAGRPARHPRRAKHRSTGGAPRGRCVPRVDQNGDHRAGTKGRPRGGGRGPRRGPRPGPPGAGRGVLAGRAPTRIPTTGGRPTGVIEDGTVLAEGGRLGGVPGTPSGSTRRRRCGRPASSATRRRGAGPRRADSAERRKAG